MRYILAFITLLTFSGILYSQEIPKKTKKSSDEITLTDSGSAELSDSPVLRYSDKDDEGKNSFLFYGGYHSYLYGYKDRRYVDTDDQGDFLKAYGQYYGIEYSHLGFGKSLPEVEDIRIGGLMTFYYRGALPSKKLYAVPSQGIPAETILPNANDRTQYTSIKIGVFAGLDEKWYELSGGFHANLEAEYEKERLRYATDGSIYASEGRGWMWSNSAMRVNFLGRIGVKGNVNFTISAFREDYDPNYGKIMAKVFFPVNDIFKMQVGAFLYPTDAVYLQPIIVMGDFSLSPRVGLIINYNDDDFEKVGIFEGMFMSLSASYNW